MYFYDDTDDWPEYKIVKDDIHSLEMAHVEFHKELLEAESAIISDPTNDDLMAKIGRLKQKLADIEQRLNESLSMYR
jgi:hypothetical protein